MPRGDGTGPTGMGPMTGRGAGYCAGYESPGFTNPAPGRGMGRGWGFGRGGRGRGWGRARGWNRFGWFGGTELPGHPYGGPVAANPDMEKQALKKQSDLLQAELEQIRKRLEQLETQQPEK